MRSDVQAFVELERLTFIRGALLRELGNNDARMRFVNTRLILTIGVDLNDFTRDDDLDQRKVTATRAALLKMGFLKEGSRG
jgi:hypothetical protein